MPKSTRVVLITGSARRIGACIAEVLQLAGLNVIIHYRHSKKEAIALKNKLNQARPHSAEILQANLDNDNAYIPLIEKAYQILTLARKDNEKLSLKLLNERLRLFDTKRNLDRFAALKLVKNSIDDKLTFAYANQPQPKSLKLPGFLGGLQIL